MKISDPSSMEARPDHHAFLIHIVSPAVLAMAAFVALIFLVVIPELERSIMERKREMIRELTASAWSLLSESDQQSRSGALSRAQAQRDALARVRDLRYGHEGKDYFWITDMTPRMVMHPYVAELEGKDLGDYRDPHGKRLFVECVSAVRARGEGYISYSWQWKDDPTRIVPKLSYVRGFAPWGWVIGTGVYIEDVRQEIRGVTRRVAGVSLGIILCVAGLLAYQGRQGWFLESRRRRAEGDLRESEARYRALVEAATEGILMVLEGRLVYANPTLLAMLGYDGAEAPALPLSELFPADDPRREELAAAFGGRTGFSAPCATRLRTSGGSWLPVVLNASGIDISGKQGTIITARDLRAQQETEAHRLAADRDRLLTESQASLLPLNGPIGPCARSLSLCRHDSSVQEAAALMAKAGSGAALVTADNGEPLGVVTDGDLLRRVLAVQSDPGRPVREFMSAPIISLPESALLFEAGLLMHERGIGRLVVTNAEGRCASLLERGDLLLVQRHSSALLLSEISRAPDAEAAALAHSRMPQVARATVEAGAEAPQVTRLTGAVSDALVARLVQLAVSDLGPPPSAFAFMVLGSAGRREQTLSADQDNAIVYEQAAPGAQEYFRALGTKVCAGLDRAGYPFCNGGVMAREAKWCRPLAEFKEMFTRWTEELGDQDLRDVNICFDFRAAAGDPHLPAQLRRHVLAEVQDKPRFLFHLADTTLQFKPPVGFFGNIQVEGSGAHAESFSIKTALVPIVNFARIYALRHGVAATNTLERLRALRGMDVLTQTGHDELTQSYGELMRLRLKHQAAQLAAGVTPDNHINPKRLTELERMMLKRIFSHIAALQARLTTDFARTV